MKAFIATLACLISLSVSNIQAHATNSEVHPDATVTIRNKSSYTITVKVMKEQGGLHSQVVVEPQGSKLVSFPKSGNFYTKTKAEKGLETLYKMGNTFNVYCEEDGYTEGSLEFYVSSTGGASGQSISKAEFEKNY